MELNWSEALVPALAVVTGLAVLVWLFPVRLWMEARAAGLSVGFSHFAGMRLRKTDPASVIRPAIRAKAAGAPLELFHLEAHYLAGGDPDRVVEALLQAEKDGVEVNFQELAAEDLNDRDPGDLVRRRSHEAS